MQGTPWAMLSCTTSPQPSPWLGMTVKHAFL